MDLVCSVRCRYGCSRRHFGTPLVDHHLTWLQHGVTVTVVLLLLQREVSLLEKAADEASDDPQLAQLRTSVTDRSKQLQKMETRVNDVKDRLFADFR